MNMDKVLEAMQANPLTRLQKEDVVDAYINKVSPDVQERLFKDDYMSQDTHVLDRRASYKDTLYQVYIDFIGSPQLVRPSEIKEYQDARAFNDIPGYNVISPAKGLFFVWKNTGQRPNINKQVVVPDEFVSNEQGVEWAKATLRKHGWIWNSQEFVGVFATDRRWI